MIFADGKLAVSLEYLCEFKEGIVYENFVLSSDETSDYLKVVLHMDILGMFVFITYLKNNTFMEKNVILVFKSILTGSVI